MPPRLATQGFQRYRGYQPPRKSYPRRAYEYMQIKLRNVWEGYLENDCLLTAAQLGQIELHKYSATGVSWLDELCMVRFWECLLQYCPIWLAPNLLTVIGLIINLSSVLMLSFFSCDAKGVAPSWAYFSAALGLFIYQSLDALDGKQARRTKSNSPLGELLDHGCDSMAQVFVALNVCYSLQLGEIQNLVFTVIIIAVTLFYCAHWSTYCTGQLRFSRFDVTEAQMLIIAILITTGIFGPKFWSQEIAGLSIKYVIIGLSSIFSLRQIFNYIEIAFTRGAGKNGSTVANSSVIYPIIPLLMVIIPFYMAYSRCTSGYYDDNITMFSLCFGAVASKTTNRIIIGYISRSKLNYWDWIYVTPFLLILHQNYGIFFNDSFALYFATVYAYISLLLYCVMICRQLCAYMRINCFSI